MTDPSPSHRSLHSPRTFLTTDYMSSLGSHQGDGGNKTQQSVIKIDPDGDLTLVVGENKTRFLVCSKTLSRSAPFWKRCLYGPFKEAKPPAGQDWVIEFPEDNPSGMKCLLFLVHGLGHKMPKIDLQLAFEVTVLTDKYDMTRSLWAVAGPWLADLKPVRPDDGDDFTIVPQLQWLWVTKELGDSHKHSEAFAELSLMVSTTADRFAHFLLRPYKLGDVDILSRDALQGYDAEKDVIFLLTDNIKAAREKALSEIQSVLKEDIRSLRNAIRGFDSSKGFSGADICDAVMPDNIFISLRKRRLCEYAMHAIVTKMSARNDSAVKPISKINMSVEKYLTHAVCFISRIEREIVLVSDDSHKACTPFVDDLPSQSTLKGRTVGRWLRENAEAFKAQARVSGLEKDGGDDDEKDQEATGAHSAGRKRSRSEFEAAASE